MEGSGSVQIITDPNLDPGGPKTYRSYRSESGFGSETMVIANILLFLIAAEANDK
jgi:hypothetical protein